MAETFDQENAVEAGARPRGHGDELLAVAHELDGSFARAGPPGTGTANAGQGELAGRAARTRSSPTPPRARGTRRARRFARRGARSVASVR